MKKPALKDQISELEQSVSSLVGQLYEKAATVTTLTAQIKNMEANWRPVPIAHEWQPRNPQCALCDEPRDAARHAAPRATMDTRL